MIRPTSGKVPTTPPSVPPQRKEQPVESAKAMAASVNKIKETANIRPAAGHSSQLKYNPKLAKQIGKVALNRINSELPRTRD